MNIRDVRLARLQELLDQHGGVKRVLAEAIGKQPAQVSQWFNHVRTIEEDTARGIESTLGLSRGWMDRPLPTRLDTGSGATALSAREEPPGRPAWPFPRIDERKFARLSVAHTHDLEAALLGVAAHLGVDIVKRKAA